MRFDKYNARDNKYLEHLTRVIPYHNFVPVLTQWVPTYEIINTNPKYLSRCLRDRTINFADVMNNRKLLNCLYKCTKIYMTSAEIRTHYKSLDRTLIDRVLITDMVREIYYRTRTGPPVERREYCDLHQLPSSTVVALIKTYFRYNEYDRELCIKYKKEILLCQEYSLYTLEEIKKLAGNHYRIYEYNTEELVRDIAFAFSISPIILLKDSKIKKHLLVKILRDPAFIPPNNIYLDSAEKCFAAAEYAHNSRIVHVGQVTENEFHQIEAFNKNSNNKIHILKDNVKVVSLLPPKIAEKYADIVERWDLYVGYRTRRKSFVKLAVVWVNKMHFTSLHSEHYRDIKII